MPDRHIYLKIEPVLAYSPVEPADHVSPPIRYRRDCMRMPGHEDGFIPADEVNARRLNALVYREYLDPEFLVPKPDKLIVADINEPPYDRRVPGTVIYTHPGHRLKIHVKNADRMPHSFHLHGLRYGIDSDGSWPFGTQAADGRRSDEICPGQTWTYTFDVDHRAVGAWPFHDHCRDIAMSIDRGLFGGIVVLPEHGFDHPDPHPLPELLVKYLEDRPHHPPGPGPRPHAHAHRPVALAPMIHGGRAGHHAGDPARVPPELAAHLVLLDELAHTPRMHHIPPPPRPLHVPLFFHRMAGARQSAVFESAPLMPPMDGMPGATYTSPPFTFASVYGYYCGVHGPAMSGVVRVVAGGPAAQSVTIVDNQFLPADVTVGVGGTVTWTNNGPSRHSVVEAGGANLPSYCLNGRSFIGNTPTILARAGQKLRWYVFNLDLGMGWHNFHPHAQRWRFADENLDVRSIGPAESFVVETTAPPPLLLPPSIWKQQEPAHRHPRARRFDLRGDFLVHCHVEMHMMQGLAALVRSQQTVWLTADEAAAIEAETGLPLDPGDNGCPAVALDRCDDAVGGAWEELPGVAGVTMMHAALLAGSSRILFWGYGPRADQSRIWDQGTGLYTSPSVQPSDVHPDQDLWSCAQAYLADGTVLAHGGFNIGPPCTLDTERRTLLFDPNLLVWSAAPETAARRFYPTTISLGDGRAVTLYGQDTSLGGDTSSAEIYTPGSGWSPPDPLPFAYLYYPWTFVLPGGDLFIAGPQKPARRFAYPASPVLATEYPQLTAGARGDNMDGSAVLLKLEPPAHAPRVMVLGGAAADAQQSVEWIDLSAGAPAWQALPPLNLPRAKLNAVLLPDGRVLVAGGALAALPDGGPVEIFDPLDPDAGWQQGPAMKHPRDYHSAAILLPDGSVVMGGDPGGDFTPHERYRPSYFFRPRPAVTTAPATLTYGAPFDVGTPVAAAIGEVVLLRPGAVTHGFNMSQRLVGCAITAGGDASTVRCVAPPDGNVAPPGPYLLFLVDRDRVPSTGSWVRLG
jgi:FtsP/CotA-like multicopper oxidase with cupredoxin domain